MDTNTKTNAKTSAMSEIRELTDDELDAVSGGKEIGPATPQFQLGSSNDGPQIGGAGAGKVSRKAGEWSFGSSQ